MQRSNIATSKIRPNVTVTPLRIDDRSRSNSRNSRNSSGHKINLVSPRKNITQPSSPRQK